MPEELAVETIPALVKLKEAKLIRYIGISIYVLEKLVFLVEKCPEIDTIQTYCRLSLLDNSLRDLQPYFQAKGIGIISGSPLVMGLLTESGPPSWHSAPSNVRAASVQMAKYCKKKGEDISSVAMRYAVGLGVAHTTLTGVRNRQDLRKNIASVLGQDCSETKYAKLLKRLNMISGAAQDGSTKVNLNLPHNWICPMNHDLGGQSVVVFGEDSESEVDSPRFVPTAVPSL